LTMAYSGGDEYPCVVGEVGSYYTKMGFAGEDFPRSYFRSSTAVLREEEHSEAKKTAPSSLSSRSAPKRRIVKRSHDFLTRTLDSSKWGDKGNGGGDGDWEIANPIDSTTGLMLSYPGDDDNLDDGGNNTPKSLSANECPSTQTLPPNDKNPNAHHSSIDNDSYRDLGGDRLNLVNSYLTHGYETSLCIPPQSSPLLLIERSYNPPPLRQTLLELAFECQNVPATFLARDAVCACYAVGRTTGTVVDVGYNGTVISPVFEGYVETGGILRSPVGGQLMDKEVLTLLDRLVASKRRHHHGHEIITTDGGYRKRMREGGGVNPGDSSPNGPHGIMGTSSKAINVDSSPSIPNHNNQPKNPNVSYAMPLYQTRTKNYSTRKQAFHALSRLDLARLCREDGSGAGVGPYGYATPSEDQQQDEDDDDEQHQHQDNEATMGQSLNSIHSNNSTHNSDRNEIYTQYANAPQTPYKLPDGTIVDIPQHHRLDIAELFFGNDTKHARTREHACDALRSDLANIFAYCESLGHMFDGTKQQSSQMGASGARIADKSGGTNRGIITSANGGIGGGRTMDAIATLEENMQKRAQRYSLGTNTQTNTSTTTTTTTTTNIKNNNLNNPNNNMDNNNTKINPLLTKRFTPSDALLHACLPYITTSAGEITSNTLPSAICDAVFKCDRDQQTNLLGNVVLCGGGACLSTSAASAASVMGTTDLFAQSNAFPERLREETEAIIHQHTPGWRVKVLSPNIPERAVCSWLGGSILGSLGTFHDMWITKSEYEEYGSAIVHRKCP